LISITLFHSPVLIGHQGVAKVMKKSKAWLTETIAFERKYFPEMDNITWHDSLLKNNLEWSCWVHLNEHNFNEYQGRQYRDCLFLDPR